jgi:hypothetical protein
VEAVLSHGDGSVLPNPALNVATCPSAPSIAHGRGAQPEDPNPSLEIVCGTQQMRGRMCLTTFQVESMTSDSNATIRACLHVRSVHTAFAFMYTRQCVNMYVHLCVCVWSI